MTTTTTEPTSAATTAEVAGFVSGLEGVVAFESAIAEPDKNGGSLRYRGVDIAELVGRVGFDDVWGLLVDDALGFRLPVDTSAPPVRSGDVRVDVQASLPVLAPARGFGQLQDISDTAAREHLAATTAAALSYVARSARGDATPVSDARLAECSTVVERFLTAWLGDPTPEQITAIDAYWVSAAEHGMNASTFTARVIASTGADVPACFSGAIGSMSGPLHGGAPARVLPMIVEVESSGDAGRAGPRDPGPTRTVDGLRTPGVSGRRPASGRASPDLSGTGRSAIRGRVGPGAGGQDRAGRPAP